MVLAKRRTLPERPLPPPRRKTDWERCREQIEAHPFRVGRCDVLHFTRDEQWAAWHELAKIEADLRAGTLRSIPADDYLRSLAPEGMVYIPPCAFLIGCPDAEVDKALAEYNATSHNDDTLRAILQSARGQHWVNLPGYYMDRTPVTNAQYRQFMEAGGYQNAEYWPEAITVNRWTNGVHRDYSGERSQPANWNEERFKGDDQPVVGVTWYEALAYCRWADKALPTEAQWEKAAGWDPQEDARRKYPWGDDWNPARCNWDQGRTTPVGRYSPAGDSAYGLADMAGNVYEWCSTRWGTNASQPNDGYPYASDEGREDLASGNDIRRIIRGGGWGLIEPQKVLLRCGYRDWSYASFRDDDHGFRSVVPTYL